MLCVTTTSRCRRHTDKITVYNTHVRVPLAELIGTVSNNITKAIANMVNPLA